MSDTNVQQELEAKLLQEVYIPAIVTEYNEKAAAAGLDPIKDQDDLNNALNVVRFIHEKGASRTNQKQASAFSKAASVINPHQDTQLNNQQERAAHIAKQAAADPELTGTLKKLVASQQK